MDLDNVITIVMSLSITGFKLLSRHVIILQVNVTLTFNIPTLKSIRVIYESWPTKTPIFMVPLGLIGFKLLSGN